MDISIKNPETAELARQLAATTGETLTGAITNAVRERLERVHGQDAYAVAERAERIRQISEDAAGRWVEPYRRADPTDILYDEHGLPH